MSYSQFCFFKGVASTCTATGSGVSLITIEIQRARFIAHTVKWMFPLATKAMVAGEKKNACNHRARN